MDDEDEYAVAVSLRREKAMQETARETGIDVAVVRKIIAGAEKARAESGITRKDMLTLLNAFADAKAKGIDAYALPPEEQLALVRQFALANEPTEGTA
jgi:hypothetical protein